MDTLVLDVGYQPVARIPWERAVTLLWEQKVEVVESYDDKPLRSASWSIMMPAVIRFLRALAGRKKAIKFSRESVYARDGGRCQYCGKNVPRQEATYDHVVPRIAGGATRWENILIACIPCNQRKGGRTPEQAGMKALSVPMRPKKLPDHLKIQFSWTPGMPSQWRTWLRDAVASHQYWNAELEQD